MGYVKNNLIINEEIVYTAKLHWIIYIPGIIILIVSFAINSINSASPLKPLFFVIFLFVGLFWLIEAFLFKTSTELSVTTKRVIAKKGLIRIDTLELNHNTIESFNVVQSILGRLLNFGSIVVKGTGGSKTQIPNIYSPMLFRKEALQIIDKTGNQIR